MAFVVVVVSVVVVVVVVVKGEVLMMMENGAMIVSKLTGMACWCPCEKDGEGTVKDGE